MAYLYSLSLDLGYGSSFANTADHVCSRRLNKSGAMASHGRCPDLGETGRLCQSGRSPLVPSPWRAWANNIITSYISSIKVAATAVAAKTTWKRVEG
ncbi:hypothetical protein ElyMa_006048800 [Elysia marginata]|uniref:Uncharacterized protein n=1 Tax=Elysia marginata TaxID=1093978 RepID=A0AAV4GM02_9GAST|nr:hypothetical protein ElyMa_006048800 [Elysia marginata]